MPVETKTLFIGLLVGLAHIASGFAVLAYDASLDAVPLATFGYIVIDLLGYSHGAVGLALLFAGFMAVVGANRGVYATRVWRSIFFIPQQVLLFLQMWSISMALVSGQYPDGYIPQGGAWFILADQIWAWVLAVSHSMWLAAFMWGAARGNSG